MFVFKSCPNAVGRPLQLRVICLELAEAPLSSVSQELGTLEEENLKLMELLEGKTVGDAAVAAGQHGQRASRGL